MTPPDSTDSPIERPKAYRRIALPYLLALNLPLYRKAGQLFADPSWAKDLARHLDYIDDLTLACPIVEGAPIADAVAVDHPRLRVVEIAQPRSFAAALLGVPGLALQLWRAIGAAALVHTGIAGWPMPVGWIAIPIARMRGRLVVLSIESAFWRVADPATASRRRRAVAWLRERISKAMVAQADHVSFTHPEYAHSLPALRAGGGFVDQASWVDETDIVADAAAAWADKRPAGGSVDDPLRLLFAGRLVPDKGLDVLIDALRLIDAGDDVAVVCSVIGAGPERAMAEAAAAGLGGRVRLMLLDPIRYGPAFFALLDSQHAVIVPSRSDEQPRIVYDAYARAVPVIASDVAGLRACVRDGETGVLVPPGDAAALADAIAQLARAPGLAEAWARAALAEAAAHTHRLMHVARSHRLAGMIDRLRPGWSRS